MTSKGTLLLVCRVEVQIVHAPGKMLDLLVSSFFVLWITRTGGLIMAAFVRCACVS